MLSLPVLLLLPPLILLLHTLYTHLTSPLRHIPAAHPLSRWTTLWISHIRWTSCENTTLSRAHARHGPIVLLSPREISVNCIAGGIREIYAGNFEKADARTGYNWYGFFANYGGAKNMFSMGGNREHAVRKRMVSNVYSKSVVLGSEALRAQVREIVLGRFLGRLGEFVGAGEKDGEGVLDIYKVLSGVTMDIVTGYVFGLRAGADLMASPERLEWFLRLYNCRRAFNYWPQEFPRFTAFVERWVGHRFAPKFVGEANQEIEEWTEAMCKRADETMGQAKIEIEDTPTVYQQLVGALAREAKKNGAGEANLKHAAASEVLDHLAAGFDTSGITLVYVVHELCRHPDIQARLRAELRTLSPTLVPSCPLMPDPRAVDALPLLHAVIWETLRLHPAIPGPQPRFTPPQGCRLGPEGQSYYVPGGVRVSASAHLLHANEDVYEGASEWKPDRWLAELSEEQRKNMESRWFWAFGSGGRMCVGSHLAVYQMKYIVAALYSNYGTAIVDDTEICQIDAYTAPPRSDRLIVRLETI